jgi:hypothetical protein
MTYKKEKYLFKKINGNLVRVLVGKMKVKWFSQKYLSQTMLLP